MPYSNFTFAKAKKDFDSIAIEGGRFLPQIETISPSARLQAALEDLPWAILLAETLRERRWF